MPIFGMRGKPNKKRITVVQGNYSALNSRSTVIYTPRPSRRHQLPTTYLDSRYDQGGVALTWASDITLSDTGSATLNSSALQTAIDAAAARSGHSRIKLPSGFIAVTVRLKKHTQGPFWTYIEWTNLSSVSSGEGQRAITANMTAAPKIISAGFGQGALWCDLQADYTRMSGIRFETQDSGITYRLVYMSGSTGSDETVQTSVSLMPRYIGLDRCWVNGQNISAVRNGIELNTREAFIVDSVINGIFIDGFESHGIVSFNGAGPWKIVGNEIEAAGINFLCGGVVPIISNLETFDIEFRRNYVHKRYSWNFNDLSTWDGHLNSDGTPSQRVVKNLFELKWGQRVLNEGNVYEGNWAAAQQGAAIVYKTENSVNPGDLGGFRTARTKNIVHRHNLMFNVSGGIECIGEGFGGIVDEDTSHLEIYNNLIYEMGNDRYAARLDTAVTPRALMFSEGINNVLMSHNTMVLTSGAKTRWGIPHQHINFVAGQQIANEWSDNIFAMPIVSGQTIYGSNYTPSPTEGINTLDVFCGSGQWVYRKNVLVNALVNGNAYPVESSYPTATASIGFADTSAANFRLLASSPYYLQGTDGTSIGVDQDTVDLATQGVVTGVNP